MSERLSDRRCMESHPDTPHWILVCGDLSCTANILADETECDPYVAALEAKLEAMERAIVVHHFDGRIEWPDPREYEMARIEALEFFGIAQQEQEHGTG